MLKFTIFLCGVFILNVHIICSQSFYNIDSIQKIEIQFTQSNWDYILDTAKIGSDSYTMSKWVKINGVQFDSAGVKYKGNSSYNQNNLKNPLHIELDHFKNQNYQGYKDIKLSNGFKDPSFVREVLAYSILQKYMKAPLSNYAQVYINGQLIGLYSNTEAISKSFIESRFYSNTNSFFFMDNFGCNLTYKGLDSTLYYNTYTLKSNYGWSDLITLCNTLKNNISNIENILDIDRVLWMLAFDNILVNLDSYIGQPAHNYYIYKDDNGRFNPIIWDVNEAFGNFTNAGTGPALTIAQEQNLSPMLHSNDSMWPLVKKLLAIPTYKRMYIAHMRTIISENFTNNNYYTYGQYLQSIIDTAVQSDGNKFYSYSQFQSNLANNVTTGMQTIVGISYLMSSRTTYLNAHAELIKTPSVISNIQSSSAYPLINSSIYLTANVSNATAVYIGKRNTIADRFFREQMFDDGLHGDGSAADGVYGVSILIDVPEIQYYIYVENNNAGLFSPARAENEFYTINSDYSVLNVGDVVINEIMAINNTTVINANGLYKDWIELYNTTSNTVSLDNLNLSDDFINTSKWQFPNGLTIAPNSFLIVWADNDTSSVEIHSSFSFSGNGEHAILSYSNGTIIDSTSYPIQIADNTWGRYPNGTGQFVFMPPTFNATNLISAINKQFSETGIFVYPNPFNNIVSFQLPFSGCNIKIIDIVGNEVFEKQINSQQESINLNFSSGIYFYKIFHNEKNIGNGKIIKL